MEIQKLKRLWETNRFVDFTIVVADKEFKTHRLVLAACSDYFEAMLESKSIESSQNRVDIKGVTAQAMESILKFCYSADIDLTNDNVQDILIAVCMLQIKPIEKLCVDFLAKQMDVSNCIGIAALADRCLLDSLYKTSFSYCLEQFQDVVKEREYLDLEAEFLGRLISQDELNIDDELQVLQAIANWYSANKESRATGIDLVLKHVRFASMDPVTLVGLSSDKFPEYTVLHHSKTYRDLIDEAKNYLLMKMYEKTPSVTSLSKVEPRNRLKCNQFVYAVGGWTDESQSISSAEVYNPNTNEWKQIASMACKRCGVGLATLGNSLYAIGGHDGTNHLCSVERYDIELDTWFKDARAMKSARTSFGVIAYKDCIYAIGGQTSIGTATDRVEKYIPSSNKWVECKPLTCRRLGAGVAIHNGFIYVIGGAELKTNMNSVERFDDKTGEWTLVKPMKTERKHFGCTTCNGKIYAIGGRNRERELDSGEVYDPALDEWHDIPPMRMRRCGLGLVEAGGIIYAVGGQNENSRLNVVEAFNPQTNTWSLRRPMKNSRLGGGVAVHPPSPASYYTSLPPVGGFLTIDD